jgi:hypothetical protein
MDFRRTGSWKVNKRSSENIAIRLPAVRPKESGVRFLARLREFSPLYQVSYTMDTGGSFLGVKAARA